MSTSWEKFRRDDGAASLIVAVFFTLVLFALAAVVIDVGIIESGRRQMQTAADAGALAGARELISPDPSAQSNARSKAVGYAVANGAEAAKVDITFEGGSPATVINVSVGANTPLAFAQNRGLSWQTVGARASATVGTPAGYGHGVMPFGIMSKEPSGTTAFGYAFGQTVTLKEPAGHGAFGNYQFIDLVGPVDSQGGGAPDIYNPLANGGVAEPVNVGETYYSQPGINGAQVANNLAAWIGGDTCAFGSVAAQQPDGTVSISDWQCHRLIVCPIIVGQDTATGLWNVYNWGDDNIRHIKILGFSWFFVESWGKTGNDSWVTGRFIRPLQPDDVLGWGPIDPWGAVGFALTQ